MRAIRVGIVGFGELGKYLLDQMKQQPDKFEVVFIHNRTPVDHPLFVSSVKGHAVDLVVEVAHPCVIKNLGLLELGCDVFVGSPTAFAEGEWSVPANVAVFVPVGALWGADDISKMRANIASLTVSMHKHPEHLRSVLGPVRAKLDAYMADEKDESPCVLYSGPVRALCPLAPNNVNTLACAALCGPGY
jgi:aspartate dehydrogenase